MEIISISIILWLLGAVFGSFVGAQVWRLRLRGFIAGDLEPGELSSTESKKLQRIKPKIGATDRSRCLECGHQLAWYDLLPVVSWLFLRGRCRYCRRSIGWTEFLLEVSLGFAFVGSFLFWPFALTTFVDIVLLGLWLVGLVLAAVLFVYDLKWFILPDRINIAYALIGLSYAITALLAGVADSSWSVVGAIVIMSGLYLALYFISSGRWVGFGDVKLGVGLGLFLLDWQLAVVAIFLANLIGTIVITPLLITKKLTRSSIVPFGPFLLIGTFIAVLFGKQFVELYISILI